MCPYLPFPRYDWCDDIPGIMKWQFFLGIILTFVCYPYCLAIVQALFSKVREGTTEEEDVVGLRKMQFERALAVPYE